MKRRNFISLGAKGFIAVTLLPKTAYAFFPEDIFSGGGCVPTTADILGPFYRAGAPIRNNLQVPGDPGTPLIFKGTVYDLNCNPLPNAYIDVWQANDAGAYDNTTPAYNYRGAVYSDSNGEYMFTSIHAGRYLNGAQYRPSHIHFRVTAPGISELITQLYFVGDPYNSIDPWASDPDAALRIVPIDNTSGTDTCIFDINVTGHLGTNPETSALNDIKIQQTFGGVLVSSVQHQINDIEVIDLHGSLVKGYYNLATDQYTINAGELAAGTYFFRVRSDKNITVHKFGL